MSETLQLELKKFFDTKRDSNPRYSLRALSRDLGVSPARLCLYFANKSILGPHALKRISQSQLLNSTEAQHLLPLIIEELNRFEKPALPSNYELELLVSKEELNNLKRLMRSFAKKAQRFQGREDQETHRLVVKMAVE